MIDKTLVTSATPFLSFLDRWMAELPVVTLEGIVKNPQKVAIFSVDLVKGFCSQGALASERVQGILPAVVSLFQRGWDRRVRNFVLFQDTHDPKALEFAAYPPHCIGGSEESQAVDEIMALPFFKHMIIKPKNSVGFLHTGLDEWLAEHPEVETFLVVGDCTDICVYQLAMHLRVDANARQMPRRVIVPADCVQTYNREVSAAAAQGGLPHDGNLLHAVFLYHMALNGIEVVMGIAD
jgi:nicotinamidase-related amidase